MNSTQPMNVETPGSSGALWNLSLVDLAEAIRGRSVTCEEVMQAHVERIEAVNPKLNALVQFRPEEALAEARIADRVPPAERGPLHGVPCAIKDSWETAGIISTLGTPGLADHLPSQDATVVRRVKQAGAIVLGKSNVSEFVFDGETDNPIYGRTNNPWDLDRTPGGSTGGGAAIVAAGGVAFDIGSDLGGSIRAPAHWCGIAGLKPSRGRVPRTGHMIWAEGGLQALWQIGPLARSVRDLGLLLSVIAGPDGVDPYVAPVPLYDQQDVEMKKLRVGYYASNGLQTATPETVETVRRAAGVLAGLGSAVHGVAPPGIDESVRLWLGLVTADEGGWLRRGLERCGTPVEASSLQDTLGALRATTSTDLVTHYERWEAWQQTMNRFFEGYDILLSPVHAIPAPPHGEASRYSYTFPYNLTGWPVVVVRAGTSPDGLPIGIQVAARPWREDHALAAAECLDLALGPWSGPEL